MEEITRVFGINWSLLLVQAVNFGLVVFILTYFLYKPVLKMMDERREKIAKGIKDADEAKKIKDGAEHNAKNLILKAEKSAEEISSLAKKEADLKTGEAIKKAEEDAARLVALGAKEAQSLKLKAIEEGREEIARLSVLAAEKLIRGN